MDKNKENQLINFDEYKDKFDTFSTSKGNVPKWNIGKYWYKLDTFGYEALAEYIISKCLEKSNDNNYVDYKVVKGIYNGIESNFSKSEDFLRKDENLITFYRLHYAIKGEELTKELLKYKDVADKIKYTIDTISEMTRLDNIDKYLLHCLELDMLFLNEDRHFNNLAVVRDVNKNKFKLAPIFDNGLSLLSDIKEYHSDDIYKDIEKVKGKPFSNSLEEQCEICNKLCGKSLRFDIDRHDIENMFADVTEFYDEKTVERVKTIIFEQMRKYQYLFR